MVLKVIIVRHGETVDNKNKIIQGHLQGKLSDRGISQAKELALKLKEVDVTHIYSSDLARAADTAKEIASCHPGVPISYMEELRERNYGDWQGKAVDEVGWDYDKQWNLGVRFGGGETIEEIGTRLRRAISRITAENKNGTVVVVGHRVSGLILVAMLKNMRPEQAKELEGLGNASLVEVDISS